MAIIEPSIPAIAGACMGADPKREKLLIILLGEKNAPDLSRLGAELNALGLTFAGGIFPGIIYGTQNSEEGALILPIEGESHVRVVEGLDREDFELPGVDFLAPQKFRQTAFVMVDGLAANIADFLWQMHNNYGERVNFFGGGAGSLSLQKQPCLFTNEGMFQDAALLLFLPNHIRLGVSHGWKKIIGPIVVTKTHKNVIYELNWENAFEVYKRVVDADSGKSINRDNFFEISKAYPFGLLSEGGEDIVRDPIMASEEGALVCVGEVPENSVLNILKGKEDSLIEASSLATESSLKDLHITKDAHPLIVDCISRALFLGENFSKELRTVTKALLSRRLPKAIGVLSLGEISSYGEGFLEFFNKTIVLGILEKYHE